MKKIISISIVLLMVASAEAQTNAVDEFFNKYSERDGFTIVTISASYWGSSAVKNAKSETSELINNLSSIRILSVNDSLLT
jgi:hypothetical protein